MDENETTVATLVGTDADGDSLTYSITGGADQDLFTIDASTGVLTFKAGPIMKTHWTTVETIFMT